MKIIIYGANEMASAVAGELFEDYDVVVVDPDQKKLDALSKLDIGFLDNGIQIARSSRLS
jgi:Trk K+ transport system NAD-binding subunit